MKEETIACLNDAIKFARIQDLVVDIDCCVVIDGYVCDLIT